MRPPGEPRRDCPKDTPGSRYTPHGVSYLLHRLGWSPQMPAHRAVERDELAAARWRTEQWSRVRGRPSSWGRG
ncbi:winged helix-turn-helix domain-containing protein [Streptomyces sp. NPDC001833]|uniref:helix-turn-helix domain-containing protein n=1 Tax=Streptomyces sp. NPDC001833 TaxID=3154658 RepID=UPI00333135B8